MPKHRSYFFKYMTMFFLWASAVLLATQALDISTSLNNAVQYISQVFVTSDGTLNGTTGVFLDGTSGGKIGIGTNSPIFQLQANGTSWIVALNNTVDGLGNEMSFLRLNATDRTDTTLWTRIFDYQWTSWIRNLSWSIKLWAGNTRPNYPSITMTTWGNVGIGTDTPTEQLQVGDYAWVGQDITTPWSTTGWSFLRMEGTVNNYPHGLSGQIFN